MPLSLDSRARNQRSDSLPVEVFEVSEHTEIDIALDRLLVDGQIALDSRISRRGYLAVAISQGRLRLRSTRFVGLIPLNDTVGIRIKPRANIANLSQMIVRAGQIPAVVEDFLRGYKPLFERTDKAIELYYRSYLASLSRILKRGLLRRYVQVDNPPRWRGRLLVSETINRYIARGIRYGAIFQFTTISHDIPENQFLKAALSEVVAWLTRSPEPAHRGRLPDARALLQEFTSISDLKPPLWRAIAELPRLTRFLPLHVIQYREALWSAYAILQRSIPDVLQGGYVSLDSMIVDISAVFEGYSRAIITEFAQELPGITVKDGNVHYTPFFTGGSAYRVQPDIMILKDGTVNSVFDVKYKPAISEQDRYEVLAFMEATGAFHAAFICPKIT
jgi:5-methylcytosine-specific restriction enzyme subunit McrC